MTDQKAGKVLKTPSMLYCTVLSRFLSLKIDQIKNPHTPNAKKLLPFPSAINVFRPKSSGRKQME